MVLGRVSETDGSGLVERAKLMATDLRQWKAWVSMTRLTTSQYRRRRTRPRTHAPTPAHQRTHSTDMEQGGGGEDYPTASLARALPRRARSTTPLAGKTTSHPVIPHPGQADGQQKRATGRVGSRVDWEQAEGGRIERGEGNHSGSSTA